MTKAQHSFLAAIPNILEQITYEPFKYEQDVLLRLLDDNSEGDSIWNIAIKSVLRGPTPEKVKNLIEQLSDQAADDAGTMAKIIGWDATLILLKLYNNADKCAKYVQTNCGEIKV